MANSKGIAPIRGRSLQAERNNDFDAQTAIAEILDNSIEAGAHNIKIRIHSEQLSKNKKVPTEISVGDDGVGMTPKILQECLVLGESTRFNSRTGIGRFGVGMTKGAIAICNKIEVYSRPHQGNWNYVKLDLKEPDQNGDPYITIVEQKSLPDKYKDLIGDIGTLVIWTDIDRIESSFKIAELEHWIGRTYRKFIGDKIIQDGKSIDNPEKISMTLDEDEGDGEQEISAFDPLYVIPNPARKKDSTAELLDDWEIDFPVSPIDSPGNQKEGKIRIRMSFTPEEWRNKEGSGGSTENNARYLYDNEGISILRNHREVAYRHVPYWVKQFKDMDRWWSCEIDFEPVLDHQFKVNNIKVGASPLIELRERLQEEINPTRYACLKKVQTLWAKNKSSDITGGKATGAHDEAESHEKDVVKPKPSKPLTLEEQKIEEEKLRKRQISDNEARDILTKIQDDKAPPIILYDSLKTSPTENCFEIEPIGNKTVVWLNRNHEFFQRVYDRIKKLGEMSKDETFNKDQLVDIASNLKTDIDNLIIAFTDSHNEITKSDSIEKTSVTFERLLMLWSYCLRRLYKNSP